MSGNDLYVKLSTYVDKYLHDDGNDERYLKRRKFIVNLQQPPQGGFFIDLNMFITLINDSKDDNARARQTTRWSALFPSSNISFIGVNSNLDNNSTLEAAGNLIDAIDAGGGQEGVLAVNVAPRGEKEEDGENGSPFAYFWYQKTLVLSTIKGFNLSLVKKLELVEYIELLDIPTVLDFIEHQGLIDNSEKAHISKTQFRSFDFQPRAAKWIMNKIEIPSTKLSIEQIPEAPDAIWYVDSFGNLKTTLTIKDIQQTAGKRLRTTLGELPIYDSLKDVPSGKTAVYSGSSGLGNNRFLEIAKQNVPGSAQKEFSKRIGSEFKVV